MIKQAIGKTNAEKMSTNVCFMRNAKGRVKVSGGLEKRPQSRNAPS